MYTGGVQQVGWRVLRGGEWGGPTKARGLRSTSHLDNNATDNGQRASSVSLKHALNSRETQRIGWNWERVQLTLWQNSAARGWRSCLIEMSKSQLLCYSFNERRTPNIKKEGVERVRERKEKRERGNGKNEIEGWSGSAERSGVKLELSCEGERGESKEKQLV